MFTRVLTFGVLTLWCKLGCWKINTAWKQSHFLCCRYKGDFLMKALPKPLKAFIQRILEMTLVVFWILVSDTDEN